MYCSPYIPFRMKMKKTYMQFLWEEEIGYQRKSIKSQLNIEPKTIYLPFRTRNVCVYVRVCVFVSVYLCMHGIFLLRSSTSYFHQYNSRNCGFGQYFFLAQCCICTTILCFCNALYSTILFFGRFLLFNLFKTKIPFSMLENRRSASKTQFQASSNLLARSHIVSLASIVFPYSYVLVLYFYAIFFTFCRQIGRSFWVSNLFFL